MATAPERSRPLHNFTLPRLKWGNQRFLRCMKVNNCYGDDRRSSALEAELGGSNPSRAATEVIKRRSLSNVPESFKKSSPLKPIGGGDSNGIEVVREKLMLDLRVADKMKVAILEEKELEESNLAVRPWNLRTRRAACKEPNKSGGGGGGGGGGGVGGIANLRSEERQQRNNCNSSPLPPESPTATATATAKSCQLRGLAMAMMTTQQSLERREKDPRAKFSNSLSREEVERDFLAIAGKSAPRRPKKRPKIVQKQVDAIFPGFWLMEITLDTYKVPDFPESGKG